MCIKRHVLLLCGRVIVADIFMIVLGLMVRALAGTQGLRCTLCMQISFWALGNVGRVRGSGLKAVSMTKTMPAGDMLRVLCPVCKQAYMRTSLRRRQSDVVALYHPECKCAACRLPCAWCDEP